MLNIQNNIGKGNSNKKINTNLKEELMGILTGKYREKRIIALILIINFLVVGIAVAYKELKDEPKILINQIGYFPNQDKMFLVQTRYTYYHGSFTLKNVENISEVISNKKLIYEGRQWGFNYYSGNFSQINSTGTYFIEVMIGNYKLISPIFKIGKNIYNKALERAYEFFYYQRCGTKVYELVSGYVGHEACHLDDGFVFYDGINYFNEWINLTGGWHSAGDYFKHNYWGFHIHGGVYSMAFAFENTPDILMNIDNYSYDGRLISNSIPDILDEAFWGILYINKTILKNGTMFGSVKGTMDFFPPEYDTDNIPLTKDDRNPFYKGDTEHVFASPYEVMWAVAAIGKFINICKQYSYFTEYIDELNSTIQNLYNNYSMHFPTTNGNTAFNSPNDLINWVPFMLASDELFKLTNNSLYNQNSIYVFNRIIASISNFHKIAPLNYDVIGHINRAIGLTVKWALDNGSIETLNSIKQLIEINWNDNWKFLTDNGVNIFGICKISTPTPYFFKGANLGLNSYYLSAIYAAILSYNASNGKNEQMLNFAFDQLNWIFGKNPYGVCMMESVGAFNPPSWHHRYAYIAGNMRGAVPGAIANGIFDKKGNDTPWFDLSPYIDGSVGDHRVSYETNEPWLPHNIQALQALSILIKYFSN
ncbi:MAG: glycoside hydrolase family 9 protein [Promethearchaeota archaeon]